MIAGIKALFAIIEAVPILRDAFWSALESYYLERQTRMSAEREKAAFDAKNATTPEEARAALARLARNRAE